MNSIVSVKNNQNENCMKETRIEQNVLNKTTSAENNNSNEESKDSK